MSFHNIPNLKPTIYQSVYLYENKVHMSSTKYTPSLERVTAILVTISLMYPTSPENTM
jgi:hypothetical protein